MGKKLNIFWNRPFGPTFSPFLQIIVRAQSHFADIIEKRTWYNLHYIYYYIIIIFTDTFLITIIILSICFHKFFDLASTNGTIRKRQTTYFTANEMPTWNQYNACFSIKAYLANTLFFDFLIFFTQLYALPW